MRRLLFPLLSLLFIAVPTQAQNFDRKDLSTTCKPCDDFYKYANEGWMKAHPIPGDHSEWGHWDEIIDRNLDILHRILDSARMSAKGGTAKKGSIVQKLGDFYASAMDTIALEQEGSKPLQAELERINQMQTLADLRKEVAHLQPMGVSLLFEFGSDIDAKNSDRVVASSWQGGLGLPEREYYFKMDSVSKSLREAYVVHVAHYFMLTGEDSLLSFARANVVLSIETALAKASMTLPEQRDPDSTYHDLSLVQLTALTPHFSWQAYLREIGAPDIHEVLVGQPKFLKSMDFLLASRSMVDWKSYFKAHLLSEAADKLDSRFDRENFSFVKLLYGVKEQLPLWKRRIRATDDALGEALGQEYVKVAFPPEAKVSMAKMIAHLREALRADLTTLDWIGDTTRKRALDKLNAFTEKIGYPDHWRDYRSLEIAPGPFVLNVYRANVFEFNRELAKIGKPVDRTEWGMTPQP